MQEQQPQEVPQQQADTSTKGGNEPAPKQVKLNRRQKRVFAAQKRKAASKAYQVSRRRLEHFKTLQQWKSEDGKLTQEQKDSVFRVALAKLFKIDFEKPGSFDRQLKAIIHNVKSGFKYKSDVIPQQEQAPQPAEG